MSKGLNIPGSMGVEVLSVGHQEQEELSAHWVTSPSIEAQVSEWGFPPLSRPQTVCPILTSQELTTDDTRHYTEIYSRLNEWNHYATNILARIRAAQMEIKNEMEQLELSIKDQTIKAAKDAGNKKPSNALLDDMVKRHPRHIRLLWDQQQKDQQKLLMESHTKRLDNDLKLISRQVTIRQGDIDNRSRGHNIPARSPGLTPPAVPNAPVQGPYGHQ